MKLRIRGNSIRFRLTQSEVAQFGDTGMIDEMLEFGVANPVLSYQLRTTGDDETIRAGFEDNCLSVSIPVSVAESWINSVQVGIEAVQPLDNNRTLRILVEKDFACLTERVGEDETDAFANPLAHDTCLIPKS